MNSTINSIDLVIKSNFCQVTVGADLPATDYVTKVAQEEFGLTFKNGYPLFLIDLYTVFAHHEYCVEKEIEFNLKDIMYSKSELDAYCNLKGIQFEGELKNFYQMSKSTLKQLRPENVIGYSPLTKALSVLLFVVNAPKSNNLDQKIFDDYEENVNDKIVEEGLNNMKNYNQKDVDKRNEDIDNPGYEMNVTLDIGETIRKSVHSINPIIKQIIQDNPYKSIAINKAYLTMMHASMYIKDQIGIGDKSLKEVELNSHGVKRQSQMMSSYGQMNKTNMVSRMLPTYQANLYKKALLVKEKVEPIKAKQGVLLLEDDSGSMSTLWKQSYIRAVVIKFLEQVALGNAEVEHVKYTYTCYGSTIANDLESAKEMFKKVNHNVPNGNGTDIAAVLQEQIDVLVSRNDLINKEIFILLDGQDSLDPDRVDPKGVVINALCLGINNEGVRAVTQKSGGKFKAIVLP